jgi:hypothetical protein
MSKKVDSNPVSIQPTAAIAAAPADAAPVNAPLNAGQAGVAPVTPAPAATPTPAPTPTPVGITDELVNQASEEYTKEGKLSEATTKRFESAGVPPQMLARYIEGQQALVDRKAQVVVDAVYGVAGGKERFGAFKEWAGQNLSAGEQAVYAEAIASGDPTRASTVTAGFVARYNSFAGTNPSQVRGTAGSAGPAPFRDRSELVDAMRDPRYSRSEAYRAEVDARILASQIV